MVRYHHLNRRAEARSRPAEECIVVAVVHKKQKNHHF
jgi:hypothetical protein